eukprot:Gb_34522 [translate_table: standard]
MEEGTGFSRMYLMNKDK